MDSIILYSWDFWLIHLPIFNNQASYSVFWDYWRVVVWSSKNQGQLELYNRCKSLHASNYVSFQLLIIPTYKYLVRLIFIHKHSVCVFFSFSLNNNENHTVISHNYKEKYNRNTKGQIAFKRRLMWEKKEKSICNLNPY